MKTFLVWLTIVLLLVCFDFSSSQRSKLSQWFLFWYFVQPKLRGDRSIYITIDLWFFFSFAVASKQSVFIIRCLCSNTEQQSNSNSNSFFSATILTVSTKWGYLNRVYKLWLSRAVYLFFFDLFMENARNSNVNCYYKWQIN